MIPALIGNCLDKIANQLADIRLCLTALKDVDAQGLAELMEHEFTAHERRLRLCLDITRSRNGNDATWKETLEPLRFLSDAFSRIHDHLSSLGFHASHLGDTHVAEVVKALELGLLKPMRRLRLHLEIPYDWHERVELSRRNTK